MAVVLYFNSELAESVRVKNTKEVVKMIRLMNYGKTKKAESRPGTALK